jgi:hypothetical protein
VDLRSWHRCSHRTRFSASPQSAGGHTSCRLTKGGAGQRADRIDGWQRRFGVRDQQGNFRTPKDYSVATASAKDFDNGTEVALGALLKTPVHQLIEDNRVDPLAIVALGYLVRDSAGGELLTIHGTLHQVLRSEDPEPLETPPRSDRRNFFDDMKPRRARLPADEVQGLVKRIVGADQKIGTCADQYVRAR